MHRIGVLATFFLLLGTVPVHAATRSRSILVSATVVPYLQSDIQNGPNTVSVTTADIEQGFVDVDGPRVDVRTNDKRGFLVAFSFNAAGFATARIEGLSEQLDIGTAGAFLIERVDGLSTSRQLRYRLFLSSASKPGRYGVPVSITLHRLR